jgi:two-component system cell cycle sensor histidine kinase/response regulator CckA
MPRLGGAAAARRIRELAPCLPVILMSGYNEDAARGTLVRNDDVSAFLPKPFSLSKLRERLVELLAKPATAAGRSYL